MGRSNSQSQSLESLRRRFTAWRRSGGKGRRIPEPLWLAATELAVKLGTHRVAKALGLDYSHVKRRVEQRRALSLTHGEAEPAFVELRMPEVGGKIPCEIEFEGSRGRFTIRLAGMGEAQIVSLAEVLSRPAP